VAEVGSYEYWRENESKYYRGVMELIGRDKFAENVATSEAKAKAADMGHSYNASLKIMKEVLGDG
jgi:hypothetical protein